MKCLKNRVMLTFHASNRGTLMDCKCDFDQLTSSDPAFPLVVNLLTFDLQFGILEAIYPPFPVRNAGNAIIVQHLPQERGWESESGEIMASTTGPRGDRSCVYIALLCLRKTILTR